MLKVNPTRMELLKLKRKLSVATRGHKLLKEKRDGLMKHFLKIIQELKRLQRDVEDLLGQAYRHFIFASSDIRPETLEGILYARTRNIEVKYTIENVMSVRIPKLSLEERRPLIYNVLATDSDFDEAQARTAEVLQKIVLLGERVHAAHLLAQEIEKTRRRVNALEYIFIPELRSTIRYIAAKLSEQERGALITVMKVKELIENKTDYI